MSFLLENGRNSKNVRNVNYSQDPRLYRGNPHYSHRYSSLFLLILAVLGPVLRGVYVQGRHFWPNWQKGEKEAKREQKQC